ncbi:uncharacterized protein KY384_002908 [Bacidia gigantensis]|uniref:uncharacterized protein n=1 Tax=Bacidia gigantensis TaxID=2732470 RepID=UPI001D03759F|nr:uncharacterized protein KY384_002908 [Bacidia gigantensis]KAG8532423.1 hypothetical protein KY384_002908 [Bacidia gigantensis]
MTRACLSFTISTIPEIVKSLLRAEGRLWEFWALRKAEKQREVLAGVYADAERVVRMISNITNSSDEKYPILNSAPPLTLYIGSGAKSRMLRDTAVQIVNATIDVLVSKSPVEISNPVPECGEKYIYLGSRLYLAIDQVPSVYYTGFTYDIALQAARGYRDWLEARKESSVALDLVRIVDAGGEQMVEGLLQLGP